MHPKRLVFSTPDDTTLVLTRAFSAPRRLVWEALFTPAKMRRWMLPPPGWTLTTCECDVRVGGALRLAWKSAEADPAMTLSGEFTEVVLHERAVHTERMALPTGEIVATQVETHELTEENGVTTMRMTQVFPSKEARDESIVGMGLGGVPAGTPCEDGDDCYVGLDAFLAEGADGPKAG